ncbi:DUF2846 domain-containing protein [Pedobacter sp. MC2016-14]|uniref:DUF2846 domain-containing protein n=1 Tax=Pedobacter sp. MC2016-14 TaxID=2897327 RepID=UPI001E2CA5FB|nr:DUF2846 domain-containing protein [Pedobacter sp. MC2016-14]MCD0488061.1 DUF2846 domain-containing protein [Pedobacter sp. MC2016-14]
MKLKILFGLILTTCAIFLLTAFKPQETGKICFIRSTNSIGSMVAYKVYIDDELVCNLKNKRYSTHNVTPGEHTVSVQNTGLSSHKKSRPLKITVAADKTNYLVVVNASDVYLQESVESSAQELLKRVAATAKCLPSEDKK